MEVFDTAIRLAGFLATLAVAGLGVTYYRRKVTADAEAKLIQIIHDTIDTQKENIYQLQLRVRIIEDAAKNDRLSREQCEKRLKEALSAIYAYDAMIGRIWIEAGNGHAATADAGSGTSGDVDPRLLRERGEEGDGTA